MQKLSNTDVYIEC